MKYKVYEEYCTGCGLCGSIHGVKFLRNERGYDSPTLSEGLEAFCSKVCPASGNALKNYQDGSIWGVYRKAYLGWSGDNKIRHASSTGGVITTLCMYLLDHHLVDGIIQIKKSEGDIKDTETIVSRSKEDVLACMGSRYTLSSPLLDIQNLVKEGNSFAFVGKPCDVSALRVYMKEFHPLWENKIKYMFTFFCGGQPTLRANNKLINVVAGVGAEECKNLNYRGYGWPGCTTITKKNGEVSTLDYETTWMKILGRDVRKACRFCADGTGELSDIACGDAWYLNANDYPDFSEKDGRNIIFARTESGEKLLKEVEQAGLMVLQDFDVEKGNLKKMQPYHYTRKASLYVYKYALKVCGRKFPQYDNKILRGFSRGFSVKQKILRFGGTIHRVIKGVV